MLVHAHGFAVARGVAAHVDVELDVRGGLPAFSVIGLGGAAARDARERVHAAVLNSGFAFPRKRMTANLAPAASARGAPAFDLVLACCVLAAQEELDAARLARIGLFAELGLRGDLRPCEGVGAAAAAAEQAGSRA
jgi:magnesium chelatase family protein